MFANYQWLSMHPLPHKEESLSESKRAQLKRKKKREGKEGKGHISQSSLQLGRPLKN